MKRWTGRAVTKLRAEILADDDVCHLVRDGGADTLDHVVPRSVRPELTWDVDNLRPAHLRCNSRRGNRTRFRPEVRW